MELGIKKVQRINRKVFINLNQLLKYYFMSKDGKPQLSAGDDMDRWQRNWARETQDRFDIIQRSKIQNGFEEEKESGMNYSILIHRKLSSSEVY